MNFVSRFVVGLFLALLTACGEHPESKEPGRNPSPVVNNKTMPPGLSASAAYEKKPKEEYETRLEAILNGYQRMIEDLKSKTKSSAKKESSPDILAELEGKTAAVAAILNRLKLASLESWQDLKPEIHAALDDLESSYDKTVLGLRESPARRDPAGDPGTPQGVVAVSTTAESN